MKDIVLSYDEGKTLIHKADVLLFKCGSFCSTGWWIGKYTNSIYSHVALANIMENNEIECLEFREFKGSQRYPLKKYIEEGSKICVFRCIDRIDYPVCEIFEDKYVHVSLKSKNFNQNIADNIVNTAIELMGRSYSYWSIWSMGKGYIPLLRLKSKKICKDEDKPDESDFVCSTLITYAYRTNFIDPVPFLPDIYTTPADLARSRIFFKLFSIE
jgi:hypothetical protein